MIVDKGKSGFIASVSKINELAVRKAQEIVAGKDYLNKRIYMTRSLRKSMDWDKIIDPEVELLKKYSFAERMYIANLSDKHNINIVMAESLYKSAIDIDNDYEKNKFKRESFKTIVAAGKVKKKIDLEGRIAVREEGLATEKTSI